MSVVSYGLGGNSVDLGRGLMHVWRWTGSKLFWIGSAGMTKLFFIRFFVCCTGYVPTYIEEK